MEKLELNMKKERIRNGKGQYIKEDPKPSRPLKNENEEVPKKKVSRMSQFFDFIVNRKFLYNLFHFMVGEALGAVTPEGKKGRFYRLIRVIHYVSNLSGRLVLITVFFFLCKSIYIYAAPFIIPIISPSEAASASNSFWQQTPPPQNYPLPSLPFYGYREPEPWWRSLWKAMGWVKYIICTILFVLLIMIMRRLILGALNLFVYIVGWVTPGDLRNLQYQVKKRADLAMRTTTSMANRIALMEQSLEKITKNTEVGEEILAILESLQKQSKDFRELAVRMEASCIALSKGLEILSMKAELSGNAIYSVLSVLQEKAIQQLEKGPIYVTVPPEPLMEVGPKVWERQPGISLSGVDKELEKYVRLFMNFHRIVGQPRGPSGPSSPGSTTYAGNNYRDFKGKGPMDPGEAGGSTQKG